MLRPFQQILRSPKVILGEILAMLLICMLGAIWQGLHVFESLWFVALAALTALSLAMVIHDQVRVLLRAGATVRRVGSAVLHAGLLLAISAGVFRALFATEAVVDLLEGEALPATAAAWSGQFPGLLATPFQLEQPVTLEAVHGSRYPDGSLRELSARLSVGTLAVNHDLAVPGGRLFLTSDFGPAALVEWAPARREAALLDSHTREGCSAGPNGLRAYLRAFAERPGSVEVRIMRGNGLLYAGDLHVGQTIALAGGEAVTLQGMPLWARLRGSRDSASWLACLGFALILAGSVLSFVPLAGAVQQAAPRLPWRTRRPRPAVPVECIGATLALVLVLTSCTRSSHEQARQLVTRYNAVVSEAYRRGDVRLIDPVVGPNEGKKLTGLIGVRLDFGLTLDAQLLALEITGVERARGELRVRTRERWHYRDRKIGTGEPVGEESTDAYEMLYVFKKVNAAWLVDEIQFAKPPQVGRKTATWVADRAALPGIEGRVQP